MTGANGLPVEGVTIDVGGLDTTTAGDGSYLFTDVFPGSYTITSFPVGFRLSSCLTIDVTLPPDHPDQNFTDFTAPVLATLTPGTVTRLSFT